ncbi:MAG TPA: glucose 1-dehydrogenase [Nitrospiraceae bacterium]|nr:glucose 1-dehydrogenase [Nitrospiraceae bacterium]
MKLQGKVAVITGSGQGIGRAIALRFAQEGAKVVINYPYSPARAMQVLHEIDPSSQQAVTIQADVTILEDTRRLIQGALDHFGQLDIVVNNAGIERKAPFWEVTESDYDAVMDVNVKGLFFVSQAAAKHWIDAKRSGRIINISSVHEEIPFPWFASYCASKGAVRMLTRDLAIELGPFGITVNAIAPGAIRTPINTALLSNEDQVSALLSQIPLGRLGRAEDVAGVAAFLASTDADYVTGSTYFVDGGLTWHYEEQSGSGAGYQSAAPSA